MRIIGLAHHYFRKSPGAGSELMHTNQPFCPAFLTLQVSWLRADAPGFGSYQVVAAVAMTVDPVYDTAGYALVWFNLAAGVVAVLLIAATSILS